MTIIAPKKNKSGLNPIIIGLILTLLVLAYWNISAYNQTVNFGHALNVAEERLRELKTANAEIKNQFYALTDAGNLLRLGEQRGLVKDSLWSAVFVSQ